MNSGLPRNKSRQWQCEGLAPGTSGLQFKHIADLNDITWNIWQYLAHFIALPVSSLQGSEFYGFCKISNGCAVRNDAVRNGKCDLLYIVFVSHLCNRIWSNKTIRISNIIRVFRSNEGNVSNYGKHKQHSSLILREIMDSHVCDIEGKLRLKF